MKVPRGQFAERLLTLTVAGEGAERVFSASLSSEAVVRQPFGRERLKHSKAAINLARAARGLPLLFNHDRDRLLGRVDNVHLSEDGMLRGTLTFSPHNEDAKRFAAEVADGFIGDISIGYSIEDGKVVRDADGIETVEVTRWTPKEASLCTMGADQMVGVGRSEKEINMTTDTTGTEPEKGGDGNVNVVAFQEARRAAQAAGETTGAQKERERIAAIEDLFGKFAQRGEDVSALKAECISAGSTPEQAQRSLLSLLAATPGATASGTRKVADDEGAASFRRNARTEANGATDAEKFAIGAERAILLRAGVLTGEDAKKERGSNELGGLTLAELAREWCAVRGINMRGRSTNDLVRYVLGEARRDAVGLGTVDFPGILANVASKSLLAGWEEAQTTWRQWCRVGSVPDFKRANRTGLSGADLLDKVPENMEYKRGDMTDRTEYMTAYTFGKLFAFTRQAIINDDLQALSAAPRKLGRAADLTVNKEVVDLLCSASGVGPTLNQDATALFHANHNNYTATSGAPSVATLEVGRAAMARQTDPNNSMPLNIQPKYLFVPSALVTTAKVLVASEKDPLGTASATGGATTPNPFYNALTVIGEPYLDDTSHTNGTVAWYLFGDQNAHDTMEVAFVNGQSAPYLESRDGWNIDGTEWKVRLDFGVSALDFRAMYRKKGA